MIINSQKAGIDDQFTSPLTSTQIEDLIIKKIFILNQIKEADK